MQYVRLWIALALVIAGSFVVLGSVGVRAVTQAPPIPQQVVSADGQVLFDHGAIQRGQGVWQSLGGQQIGSIWGHGAYIAPDWTTDWLHREAVTRLDQWARATGAADFAALSGEQQAALQARLQEEMRTNTYDPATGRLRISAARAEAFEGLARYYAEVFAQGREAYAIPRGVLTDPVKARHMATFFCMMNTLRWLRVIGDTIFAIGALAFGWFVLGLATGQAYDVQGLVVAGEAEVRLTTGSAPSCTGEAP
jgi:nitric oxide reductase subunit B